MRKGLIVTLLWLAVGVTGWELQKQPGTQLEGELLLAVTIGSAATLVIPAMAYSAIGDMIDLRRAPRLALFHAAALLTVAMLAVMGHWERSEPEYVWKYGRSAIIEVPERWYCRMGSTDCHGSWTVQGPDDSTHKGTVRIWQGDFEKAGLSGMLPADQADGTVSFEGRALGDVAVTSGYADRRRESVVLGQIPAVVGWLAGGVGIVLALYSTAPVRGPRR